MGRSTNFLVITEGGESLKEASGIHLRGILGEYYARSGEGMSLLGGRISETRRRVRRSKGRKVYRKKKMIRSGRLSGGGGRTDQMAPRENRSSRTGNQIRTGRDAITNGQSIGGESHRARVQGGRGGRTFRRYCGGGSCRFARSWKGFR